MLERGKSSERNDDKLDILNQRIDNFRKDTIPIISLFESQKLAIRVS